MMETIPSTFVELLALLVSPAGAWFLVTWFAAWALDKWDVWMNWTNATGKKLVMLGLALGISALASWLGNQPDLLAVIEPYYSFLATFIAGWLSLETFHKADKFLSARGA
jgi:hypothetical protein